jgi:putative component of toxin-antitoxin plasmid stabilization module
VEDKLLQADKGSGHLVSKNSYGDFQIRAEFWVVRIERLAAGNPGDIRPAGGGVSELRIAAISPRT